MKKFKIIVRKWQPIEEYCEVEAESENEVRMLWADNELDMTRGINEEAQVVGIQVFEIKEAVKTKKKKGA